MVKKKLGPTHLASFLAQESQRKQRQPDMFPKLLVAIFLGVALLSLAVAGFSGYSAAQAVAREEQTPGWVVELAVRSFRDSSTGDVNRYTYPVVEFTMPGRQTQRVQMPEGASTPDYAVGDEVVVLYDPQPPHNFRIKSFASDLMLWILPGITFLLGAAFLTATLIVVKVWSPNSSN